MVAGTCGTVEVWSCDNGWQVILSGGDVVGKASQSMMGCAMSYGAMGRIIR